MKKNWVKLYAISISIAAAILVVLVIVLALKLKTEGEHNIESESAQQVQMISENTEAPALESSPQEETTEGTVLSETSENETEDTETAVSETQDNIFNVSGRVKWEAGNNDFQNIVNAWSNTLEQLDLDVDIAFIGDSLTNRCDFRIYFPEYKVINLGTGGDTIRGVYNRTKMLSYLHAEKVVIMCGVNDLRNDNMDDCRTEYGGLLNAIMEYTPDSEVYVCSILPMRKDWQDEYCLPETTKQFNEVIRDLAEKRDMTYVDLYPLFELDNEINPDYTIDGVHLSDEGYDVGMAALRSSMF